MSNILDELERLHKAASVYSFHNSSLEDVDWVRFIESCQKHLPALIQVARAAEYLLDHVNRDYAEWKEPLEKALEKLNER